MNGAISDQDDASTEQDLVAYSSIEVFDSSEAALSMLAGCDFSIYCYTCSGSFPLS